MRVICLGLLLILGCSQSPVQDPPHRAFDPAALFARAEAALHNAKTIRVDIWSHIGNAFHVDRHGGLLIDSLNNRVHYQMRGLTFGTQKNLWLVSDGKTLTLEDWPQEKRASCDAPANIARRFVEIFSRAGSHEGLHDAAERLLAKKELQLFEASDFQFLRLERMDERDYAVIKYAYNNRTFTLWIDLSSGLPFKRIRVFSGDLTATLTETYTEFATDIPVAVTSFEPPK